MIRSVLESPAVQYTYSLLDQSHTGFRSTIGLKAEYQSGAENSVPAAEPSGITSEILADGNAAYLKIDSFALTGYEAARTELENFFAEIRQVPNLIIDLRGNPGGLVTAVCDTLRQILPEGLIVYTEDKNGKREEYTCDGDTPISIPLVVLVNENTASAAEIFTGAVKDYGIGTIVGTTTFGKGIVQNTFQLSDGSVVKLTIAHYYTPLGNDIHKVGITPDVEVELPDDATSDVQLEKALEVVKGLESAE